MFDNSSNENLTVEEAEVVDGAAQFVLQARRGAAAMLVDAGLDGSWFDSPCTANFDGTPCPCSNYTGPGPCRSRITPAGVPMGDSTARCSHRAGLHLPS